MRPEHWYLALALVVSVFVVTMTAKAQQNQPQQVYTLTFNAQEVQIIGTALIQRPYSEVYVIMRKLEEQVAAQNKPKDAK